MDQPTRERGQFVHDRSRSPALREPLRHQQSTNWRDRNASTSNATDNRHGKTASHGHGRDGASAWRPQPQESDALWNQARETGKARHPHGLEETSNAVSEGRRIYLGNILYHVRPEEITEALEVNGFGDVEQIHISIDPVTGRNPGYCFVEFVTREMAEMAIKGMSGVLIKKRPLKTGPCQPKSLARGNGRRRENLTFERWGDWQYNGASARLDGQGPIGAEEHLIDVVQNDQCCRVYVGGLGKMVNQDQNDQELRQIFRGFKVLAIGKRITPHASTREKPGKHHYAFVDLETRDEAYAAIEALDGLLWHGSRLKVRVPADLPQKIRERGSRYIPSNENPVLSGMPECPNKE